MCAGAGAVDVPASFEPASEWFARTFQGLASSLTSRYGGPIYLVGSALVKPAPLAGDYDVRVLLENADIERLFGTDLSYAEGDLTSVRRWRWLREELKQARRMSRAMRVNIDFQFQHAQHQARYAGKPRLRLDKATDEYLAAGLGDF